MYGKYVIVLIFSDFFHYKELFLFVRLDLNWVFFDQSIFYLTWKPGGGSGHFCCGSESKMDLCLCVSDASLSFSRCNIIWIIFQMCSYH